MPYHDLSVVHVLLAKQCAELKTQLKHLFKRHKPRLELPPSEFDHNAPPPDHWMGFWICSTCKAYIYPKYRPGPHPYDYLCCLNPDCNAVIGPAATSSKALSRFHIVSQPQSFLHVPRLTGPHRKQIPYFCVCPCGLTHRARLHKRSLYEKFRDFSRDHHNPLGQEKSQLTLEDNEDGEVTLIEFEHIQCNKCYRWYDPNHWQHFVIYQDAIFHIDGGDDHGRWAEIRHKA